MKKSLWNFEWFRQWGCYEGGSYKFKSSILSPCIPFFFFLITCSSKIEKGSMNDPHSLQFKTLLLKELICKIKNVSRSEYLNYCLFYLYLCHWICFSIQFLCYPLWMGFCVSFLFIIIIIRMADGFEILLIGLKFTFQPCDKRSKAIYLKSLL